MTKEQLLKLYNLHQEIRRIENSIFNEEFYEGTGFVWFKKLRGYFNDVYKEFDNQEYDLLSRLETIIDDGLQVFDFNLLTKEDRIKLTSKEGNISILKSEEKNYAYCIIKFKNIDEVMDYILINNL